MLQIWNLANSCMWLSCWMLIEKLENIFFFIAMSNIRKKIRKEFFEQVLQIASSNKINRSAIPMEEVLLAPVSQHITKRFSFPVYIQHQMNIVIRTELFSPADLYAMWIVQSFDSWFYQSFNNDSNFHIPSIHPFANTSQSFGAWSCMPYSCPLNPILHHPLKFVTTWIAQQLLGVRHAAVGLSSEHPSSSTLPRD